MRYVALLRGINVGGNNKVPMSELKHIFERMGYKNVSTYINSGNVLFESTKKDFSNIERILKKTFGFEIKVVIRDEKNIATLCRNVPPRFKNDVLQKTDILFLWDTFDNPKTIQRITINPAVDTLLYCDGAIIWNLKRKNYSKSGMHKFIGTEVYKHMTARNVNTVRKLGALMK